MGTRYAGFQVQKNANTIQAEVEKALAILLRKPVMLTGSSRTDSGVHAVQNYFHFDTEDKLQDEVVYNINALLPDDIALKKLIPVGSDHHCRFDAVARLYTYRLYRFKDPFLRDQAYYYPYKLNIDLLQAAADQLLQYSDYTSFSKRRTQVQTYECKIFESRWDDVDGKIIFTVRGNRFLRGMVRGLVGTMLHVGRGKMELSEFKQVVEGKNSASVDFSVPAKGLFLMRVDFRDGYLREEKE